MRRIVLMSLCIVILIAACKEPAPLAEDASFESVGQWPYGKSYEFNPAQAFSEHSGTARIAVAVRHTDSYLYSNLWLELATPLAGTDSMRLDTVNVKLADVYGKWLGRGLGVSFITTDTLPGRYVFDDEHPARLRHIMRIDTLTDVEQVGLIYFDKRPLD